MTQNQVVSSQIKKNRLVHRKAVSRPLVQKGKAKVRSIGKVKIDETRDIHTKKMLECLTQDAETNWQR